MTTYRLDLVFCSIERNDETFDLLETVPNVHWVFQSGLVRAVATVSAASAIDAAKWLIAQVADRVPSARPVRLDRDFVAIPDIADRLGVNRETVRAWAKGSRRSAGDFPIPAGVVGDGIRIWPWAMINDWAKLNIGLGDGFARATEEESCQIDLLCAEWMRKSPRADIREHWTPVKHRKVSVKSHSSNFSLTSRSYMEMEARVTLTELALV